MSNPNVAAHHTPEGVVVLETPSHRGKVVVTGGSHGIGGAIVRRMLDADLKVCIVDRDLDEVENKFGPHTMYIRGVLGESDEILLARQILSDFGTPEIVVNNVGINDSNKFEDTTRANVGRILATNLEAPWSFTKMLTDAMVGEKIPGRVVFVFSLYSSSVSTHPAYSVSKAGVDMLVREMAWALAKHGIRVNAVRPGWINIAREGTSEHNLTRSTSWVPLGRGGTVSSFIEECYILY